MRPLPGGDAFSASAKPQSRKSSVDHATVTPSHVPTTFLMRREGDLEQASVTAPGSDSCCVPTDSTYGVQSLADTLESAFGCDNTAIETSGENTHGTVGQNAKITRSSSSSSANVTGKAIDGFGSPTSRVSKRQLSTHVSSGPYTPLNLEAPSPMHASAMTSPPSAISLNSLKLSDEESGLDDHASQAIMSSGEEEGVEVQTKSNLTSSFPQLVMPSIQMPARRPFTTRGKAMGKLKILFAGETGIGKTSLIRSIVQVCEDIVHVDPLSPSSSSLQMPPPKSKSRRRKSQHIGTTRVTEIHASTKPYPPWWTEVEDSRATHRRKSGIDTVLERNISFVDSPGMMKGSTAREDMSVVVEYVEALLHQMTSLPTLEDGDVLDLIGGSGGISVDLVIYLLPPNKDISEDIEFMQRLSHLTNVMPVIAKSDTISAREIVALKTSLLARLQTTSVKPFLFGKPLEDALLTAQSLTILHPEGASAEADQYPFSHPTYPYAISSTLGPDNETMDASLLMSPDYVQPLLPSELSTLVHQVFDPESIAWLRHSAAKKFLAWQKRNKIPRDSFILRSLQQARSPTTASVGIAGLVKNASTTPSVFSAASPTGILVPHSASSFYASNVQSPLLTSPSITQSDLDDPTNFSLARYNNSSHTDQPLSEIRIAKWATDLQRSLRNERDRFEELQSKDRAKWLLERVGEEVSRGTIVASPGGSPRADWAMIRHNDEKHSSNATHRYSKAGSLDSRDPLGLCTLSDEVKRRSFALFKVLGGVSVLGAIVVTAVKAFGLEAGLPQNGWWNWATGGVE